MDAFRYVELPDPYIYVIDPTDGHTKAVVDKFFSFLWVERRTEAGELEITAPEDVYWGEVIQEGDYVQFMASSKSEHFREGRRPSNVGRYTMVVETKYTTYDADKGYTTYVKGHSLDILLNRRINLGITTLYLDSVAKNGFISHGTPVSGYDTPYRLNTQKPKEDKGEGYFGLTYKDETSSDRNDSKVPFIIENVASNRTEAEIETWQTPIAELIYMLIDSNCGERCKNVKRRFPNFEIYRNQDIKTSNLIEPLDGKFENLYDLVTDLLKKAHESPIEEVPTDQKKAVGMRLVGWAEGIDGEEYKTIFKMGFELYVGNDLTINGPHKSDDCIVYSRDMDNLISMNYLNGEANYKNVIYFDTGLDYTPDDLWAKQKELEKKNKEKDLLDSSDEAKEKKLELEIDTLEKAIEKLEKKYEDLGLRMPYVSVMDRNQIRLYKTRPDEVDISKYPEGLDRRELYVDEELPFYGSAYGYDFSLPLTSHDDEEEVEWQGRPFLGYRYTIREDPKNDGDKPVFKDRWMQLEWDVNTARSMADIARRTFKQSDNSKENAVEAELNYNAIYQPKRNYDLGDIVTVMGVHHNEIIRDARIDEMAYSIDPSGYTIVPTFTVLPSEDDTL